MNLVVIDLSGGISKDARIRTNETISALSQKIKFDKFVGFDTIIRFETTDINYASEQTLSILGYGTIFSDVTQYCIDHNPNKVFIFTDGFISDFIPLPNLEYYFFFTERVMFNVFANHSINYI